jgi:hypothetical protein
MRAVIIGFIVVSLLGCGSVMNRKLPKATIGSFAPAEDARDFCQSYTGYTMFGNERTNYSFSSDFKAIYSKGIDRGITKYGSRYVDLGAVLLSKLPDYFDVNSWSHKLTVTEEGRKYFSSNPELMKTDYFIVPWVWREHGCVVTWSNSVHIKEGELVSKFKATLIRTRDFENVGSRLLISGTSPRKIHTPANHKKITEDDIELFINDMTGAIEDHIFRMLDGDTFYGMREDIPMLPE